MKKFYQPKGGKKGNYALRENTYRRIWYLIADYPYFKELQGKEAAGQGKSVSSVGQGTGEEFDQVKDSAQGYTGAAGRSGIESSSGHALLRENTLLGYKVQGSRFQYRDYIAAIEAAQKEIPEGYVDAVMSHIISKKKYKDIDGISETTLKIWVQRFIWHVANKLGDV